MVGWVWEELFGAVVGADPAWAWMGSRSCCRFSDIEFGGVGSAELWELWDECQDEGETGLGLLLRRH